MLKWLWRWAKRLLIALVVLALLMWALIALAPGFGAAPKGERLARMQASPQWQGDRFHNPQPMWNNFTALERGGPAFAPAPNPDDRTQEMVADTAARLGRPPRTGLRITWFGHSSSLIEIDGVRVLADPIWSTTATPLWIGVNRWFRPLVPLEALRDVDAVVISHDHYDHLDMPTIKAMRGWQTRFIVPLGVGAHLERWGIPASRITELDWWEDVDVKGLNIAATPARHATGRINPRSDRVLWAGYALLGPRHRVWYSGDTGLHDTVREVGSRYGPFDATLIEVGQYSRQWPDWHIGPEQAVMANQWAHGKTMIPVHWALFDLSPHGWNEPAERTLAAARCQGVQVATPEPGVPWEPGDATSPWWPRNLPWQTAAQDPIVSTRDGDPTHRYPLPECVERSQD